MSLDIELRDPAGAGPNLSILLFTSGGPVLPDPVDFVLAVHRLPFVFDIDRSTDLAVHRNPFSLPRAQE